VSICSELGILVGCFKAGVAPAVALPGETASCLSTYQASFSRNFKVIAIGRCWLKSRASSAHVSVRSCLRKFISALWAGTLVRKGGTSHLVLGMV
jgi:hypothetical protein